MSRLLFLVIVIIVVFWLLKSYGKRVQREDTPEENRAMQAEDMVCCAHCGVHLPKRDGVFSGGKYYCSEEHLRMHANKID